MSFMGIDFSTSFTPSTCEVSTISYSVVEKTSNAAIANINADSGGVSIKTSDYTLIGNR